MMTRTDGTVDVRRHRWAGLIPLVALVLGAAAGCRQQSRSSQTPYYSSVSAAREKLPSECRPILYVLDGVLQSDSVRVYSLAADSIARVELVRGSGAPRCPVVMVETKRRSTP